MMRVEKWFYKTQPNQSLDMELGERLIGACMLLILPEFLQMNWYTVQYLHYRASTIYVRPNIISHMSFAEI